MPEQLDFFKKKIKDEKIVEPNPVSDDVCEPTDEDRAAAISVFEEGGRSVKIINPRVRAQEIKNARKRFGDWRQTNIPE